MPGLPTLPIPMAPPQKCLNFLRTLSELIIRNSPGTVTKAASGVVILETRVTEIVAEVQRHQSTKSKQSQCRCRLQIIELDKIGKGVLWNVVYRIINGVLCSLLTLLKNGNNEMQTRRSLPYRISAKSVKRFM
jgi:hypothetical protein